MIIHKILDFGVAPANEEYVNFKIRLANGSGLVIAILVLLPLSAFAHWHIRPIGYLLFLGGLGQLVGIGFNAIGLTALGRIFISLAPVFVVALSRFRIESMADGGILSLAMLELGFSLLPLAIFDFREKYYLYPSTLLAAATTLSHGIFSPPTLAIVDTALLRQGYLYVLLFAASVGCALGCVVLFVYQNRLFGLRSEALLAEVNLNNARVRANDREMNENLEKIKANQAKEQAQLWVGAGVAAVNKILSANHGFSQTCDQALAKIIAHMGINQGAILLLDEPGTEAEQDAKALHMVSAFAFDRKKFIDKKIPLGHGLVGEAFANGQRIYMENLPASYAEFTSGIGGDVPKTLLIMPMMNNGQAMGVLELGAFRKLEQQEFEFVQKVCDAMAALADTVKTRAKTEALLTKSTRQTDQLRVQEQQMRQNAEELLATQEALSRQKTEMEEEIKTLKAALKKAKEAHS